MKKAISRCSTCKDVFFMAVYDTPEEIMYAGPELTQLESEGHEIEIIDHTIDDEMPKWCSCKRGN